MSEAPETVAAADDGETTKEIPQHELVEFTLLGQIVLRLGAVRVLELVAETLRDQSELQRVSGSLMLATDFDVAADITGEAALLVAKALRLDLEETK